MRIMSLKANLAYAIDNASGSRIEILQQSKKLVLLGMIKLYQGPPLLDAIIEVL